MIVQKRLNRRVERGLNGEATLQATLASLPIIGPDLDGPCDVCIRVSAAGCIQPTSGIPFVQQNAETLADDNFARGRRPQ